MPWSRTFNELAVSTPEIAILIVALGVFDVIDEHPWVGSVLTSAPGLSPMVRDLCSGIFSPTCSL